jgi:hypothetical protein
MSTTIPKRSIRAGQLEVELTRCTVYSETNDFTGRPCNPDYAWDMLRTRTRAKLTDNGNGTYTIRVHDNLWYELQAGEGRS